MGQNLYGEVNFLDGVSVAYNAVRPLFDDGNRSIPSAFATFWTDALDGQRLIDDEAERGARA